MEENTTWQAEDVALFFNNAIKRIYWAEKNIRELLDQMHEAAYDSQLKHAIETHIGQTQLHIERLEQVLRETNGHIEELVCEALQGLLEDTARTIRDTKRKTRSRDIGITAALLKIEHYEMATYSILIPVARSLGYANVITLLEQSLHEERQAEAALSNHISKPR